MSEKQQPATLPWVQFRENMLTARETQGAAVVQGWSRQPRGQCLEALVGYLMSCRGSLVDGVMVVLREAAAVDQPTRKRCGPVELPASLMAAATG